MLATDRDLLPFEPNLFRDVGWLGQTLARGTASLSAGVLTWTGIDLAALGVAVGHVAAIDSVPVEIVQVLAATQARVSLLRAAPDEPFINPSNTSNKPSTLTTFRPQLRIVNDQVLRLFGFEPIASAAPPGAAAESAITNPRELARLVALGALHLIYGAAAASGDSAASHKSAMYRARFADARQRTIALVDTDGDGVPDARRAANALQFVRA